MAKVKLYDVKVETQEQLEQLVIDIKNALADLSPSLAHDYYSKAYDYYTKDDVLSVIDIIDNYIEDDYVIETYDGDLYSAIIGAIYEYSDKFYYYSDGFDYLKEHKIYDFKDAVANGYARDVCTIATYYYQEGLLNAFNQVVE